jgi:hypothetical protein
MPDPDIWDEDQWESYLRQRDERVARYAEHFYTYIVQYPPPDRSDQAAYKAWHAELQAYMSRHGWQPDEADFPYSLSDLFIEFDALQIDDAEAAEADPAPPILQPAFQLAADVLEWSDRLPGGQKNSTLVHFCASVMQIAAHLSKGHALGVERDRLGGNIAYVKRALFGANTALDMLHDLKAQSYMQTADYIVLYERVYEIRNGVALFLQDLRARFDLGID